ncbi:MAG: LPS export ABC transporter periplasmic protein LptC [Bacteroidales bacterium]
MTPVSALKVRKSVFLILLAGFALTWMPGCENSIETINTLTRNPSFPTLSRNDTEIRYTDSARLKIVVYAPRLERYTNTEKPYIEFPKGIHVDFYNDSAQIESTITAKYARYDEKEKIWTARNDVVARNIIKNEQLNTEEIFWDENKKIIYSLKFTRIMTSDGIFYGDGGFEADQEFTRWKLKKTRGSVNVKDEE